MKMNLLFVSIMLAFFSSFPVFAEQYCSIGEEKWVAGCEAKCTAGWEGNDCPKSCTATAPAGFVIMDYRHHNHSENHGGHDVSRIAAGQSFDYKRRVEQAYGYALDLAGKLNDKSAEAKIKQDMNGAISEAESFNSSHQVVRVSVSASKHGSVVDRKGGWSHQSVEILVKCVVPQNLEEQLMKKYALQ